MTVNLQAFTQLGAFPGEVGPGNIPGGIGGPWPMNLPLNYWWNYGSRIRSRRSLKKRKYSSKRSKRSRSKFGNIEDRLRPDKFRPSKWSYKKKHPRKYPKKY